MKAGEKVIATIGETKVKGTIFAAGENGATVDLEDGTQGYFKYDLLAEDDSTLDSPQGPIAPPVVEDAAHEISEADDVQS